MWNIFCLMVMCCICHYWAKYIKINISTQGSLVCLLAEFFILGGMSHMETMVVVCKRIPKYCYFHMLSIARIELCLLLNGCQHTYFTKLGKNLMLTILAHFSSNVISCTRTHFVAILGFKKYILLMWRIEGRNGMIPIYNQYWINTNKSYIHIL